MDKAENNEPNIFVGKIFNDQMLTAEILNINDNGFKIKVLNVKDSYFQRYLEVNKIYDLVQLKHWQGDLLLFEIPSEQMNSNNSQVLLQFEKGLGWGFDLDS
jgi:hypothetical protein